eukprot:4404771-Pyramimonas_sp.AAC.1
MELAAGASPTSASAGLVTLNSLESSASSGSPPAVPPPPPISSSSVIVAKGAVAGVVLDNRLDLRCKAPR